MNFCYYEKTFLINDTVKIWVCHSVIKEKEFLN